MSAAIYRPATINSKALIPVTNVRDWSKPPARAPKRFAPKALSFSATAENDRMKTMPLKNIGRLVNPPTMAALVA